MLIPTFDSSGKCVSLHLKKGDNFVLVPLKRNGAKAELDTSDPSYGYLAQEAIASPTYATLDLSDRPPTPAPALPPDFASFGRSIRSNNFWKNKIRKTLQKEAFVELSDEMMAIAIVGPSTERLQSLAALWNEVVGSLTVGVTIAPADVTLLNSTATANRVPLVFASNGTVSVSS